MKKFLLWLTMGSFVMVCLASCTVVKDPVTVSYVDINTGVKAGRDVDIRMENPHAPRVDVAKRLADVMEIETPAVAASAPGVKMELCERYKAPALPPIPKMTAQQVQDISKSTPDQYNEALLIQIERVYRYAKQVEQAHAKAVELHKKSCRIVTVQ